MSFFEAALRTSRQLRQRQAILLSAFHPAEPARARWATPCQERLQLGDSLTLRRWGQLDSGPVALVITPQVNHSCIADFSPQQSLVRTLRQAGVPQVAVTDWLGIGKPGRYDRSQGLAAGDFGSTMVNVAPAPGRPSAPMRPPWASTSSLHRANPSPLPG